MQEQATCVHRPQALYPNSKLLDGNAPMFFQHHHRPSVDRTLSASTSPDSASDRSKDDESLYVPFYVPYPVILPVALEAFPVHAPSFGLHGSLPSSPVSDFVPLTPKCKSAPSSPLPLHTDLTKLVSRKKRNRSADVRELHFIRSFSDHGPDSRIRVWANDRNMVFYDCHCGKRKPLQDFKKIQLHAHSHDRVEHNCPTCGRMFGHYLQLNAHQRVHKLPKPQEDL